LLQHFHQVFERDRRGAFPLQLIETLRWTKCSVCGAEHARPSCPQCAQPSPAVREVVTIRGKVTATRIFQTRGVILFAALQSGKLRWLCHENGQFKREDESVALRGNLDPRLRFRLCGRVTLVGRESVVFTLTVGQATDQIAVDSCGNSPVFDANERCRYWLQGGQLWRDGQLGPEHVGDVLSGQTLFWVGATFGFGFYRAGNLCVAFVFDAQRRGINDAVKIPPIRGQLIDSTCVFASDRCWFFVATQDRGKTVHQCVVVGRNGGVEAAAQAEQGDGSWLGTLHGKCAVGNVLFAPTDDGIVRVEVSNGQIHMAAKFPDTEAFVDAGCHLFPAPQGLYVVSEREICLLRMA
jgi:H/ACA ribonucleoprotein complex subunit 3